MARRAADRGTPRPGGRTGRREMRGMADPTGFEPAISSVTGWHVGPLHHGSTARGRMIAAAPRSRHGGRRTVARILRGDGGVKARPHGGDWMALMGGQPAQDVLHVHWARFTG